MPRTILLIDGDQYLHRACAAVERDTRWDEENHVLSSNEVEAWEVVEGSIKKVLDHFGSTDHVICLSEGEVFRKNIDPSYKSNRKDTRKPLCFYDLKDKLKAEYKCVFFNGLEADDVMGILSTKPGPDSKIIVAKDKDMLTIPGKLWDGSQFSVISEEQADYFHLYQTLVGDASDGYKGCPGIGPKKAEALLASDGAIEALHDKRKAWWIRVSDAFIKAGLTEAGALRQARLARILRWCDWDNKLKVPILWTP
jgi:DNA polymerase-1